MRSAARPSILAFARAERANIDAALAWSATHDPLLALEIVNGFGWAWVVLGDSRGAQRIHGALDAAGDAAPARDRPTALLLAAWIEASTGDLELARDHIAAAAPSSRTAIDDVDLQARCCYYLAYVVSHHGDWEQALELTDRSRALYDGARPAVGPGRQRALRLARGDLRRRRGAQRRGARPGRALAARRSTTRGCTFAATRCSASWPASSIASTTPSSTSVAPPRRRERLGFRQTEAYQVSSLGRAQCQAGDYETGAATLALAIDKAEATGDVRLAALARVHLGRVLRALGRRRRARAALEAATAWHRAVGGGEQAALGECLLAAMDAADGVAGAAGPAPAILDDARRDDDAHVEVFALDALARIARRRSGDVASPATCCDAADRRMAAASHFITERDRIDAHAVRQRRLTDRDGRAWSFGRESSSSSPPPRWPRRARAPRSFTRRTRADRRRRSRCR